MCAAITLLNPATINLSSVSNLSANIAARVGCSVPEKSKVPIHFHGGLYEFLVNRY